MGTKSACKSCRAQITIAGRLSGILVGGSCVLGGACANFTWNCSDIYRLARRGVTMQNDSSSCTRRTADSDALAAASTRDREPGAGLSSERNLQRAPKRAKRARVLSRNRHHCDRGHETSGQPPPAWSSTDECRPPAVLEYYENDTCGEGGKL